MDFVELLKDFPEDGTYHGLYKRKDSDTKEEPVLIKILDGLIFVIVSAHYPETRYSSPDLKPRNLKYLKR